MSVLVDAANESNHVSGCFDLNNLSSFCAVIGTDANDGNRNPNAALDVDCCRGPRFALTSVGDCGSAFGVPGDSLSIVSLSCECSVVAWSTMCGGFMIDGGGMYCLVAIDAAMKQMTNNAILRSIC